MLPAIFIAVVSSLTYYVSNSALLAAYVFEFYTMLFGTVAYICVSPEEKNDWRQLIAVQSKPIDFSSLPAPEKVLLNNQGIVPLKRTASFANGDYVVYEFKNCNSGRKYICNVVGNSDGWILDINQGTCISASFRPEDVIVWEHKKKKSK
jgi:hypothetical protein